MGNNCCAKPTTQKHGHRESIVRRQQQSSNLLDQSSVACLQDFKVQKLIG